MYVEVIVDGRSYRSKGNDEVTASEAAHMFYDDLENMDKFQLELPDGGHVLFSPDAVKKSVVIFHA